MKMSDVSIIIPALNEEKAIESVIKGIKKNLPDAEIIVVNDGSTDRTKEIALSAGATVLSHEYCRGYGASLRTGIIHSKNSYVLFCDADGQHSAEDVRRVIDECNECEMVVGARGRKSHTPLVRAPGKLILRNFANFLAGQKIPDLNSGLRIIKKEILMKYLHLMPTGFSFSTTSTFAMLKGNYRIKWVPITVTKRIGESTVRQWKHGPQTLMLMLRLTVLFEPLKIFLISSGIMLLLSIISLSFDLYLSESMGIGDSTVMLSIATLLIFLFGLICDQVSALRRELHEK